MNNLFHVKPSRNGKSFSVPLLSIGAMLLLLNGQPVLAGVHKCTSSDGRVRFSDLPCAAGQLGGATKIGAGVANAQSPPMPRGIDTSEAARATAPVRLRPAQSPECNELGDRIKRYVEKGTGPVYEGVVKADTDRFDKQCAARACETIQLEMEQSVVERKQQETQLACREKRRMLDARRGLLASLNESDQRAVSGLESEVTRDFR